MPLLTRHVKMRHMENYLSTDVYNRFLFVKSIWVDYIKSHRSPIKLIMINRFHDKCSH